MVWLLEKSEMETTVNLQISLESLIQAVSSLDLEAR